jgi:hypothetical protein
MIELIIAFVFGVLICYYWIKSSKEIKEMVK